jgi:hypothetical protein
MKKQLLKICTICIVLAIGGNVKAQKPTANIAKSSATITIDGSASDWAGVAGHNIDKPFRTETPTLSSATWKAVWDDNGIYVIVEVSDNLWFPSWVSGKGDWESDKAEVYFDVSDPLDDATGASIGYGNYQIGNNFTQANTGIAFEAVSTNPFPKAGMGVMMATKFDGVGGYVCEYYVPFSALDGVDPITRPTIGFDVTILDLDAADGVRQRAVWANTGAIDESWANMDDVGLITFTTITSIKDAVAKTNILVSNVVNDGFVKVNSDVKEIKILNAMGQVVKTSNQKVINVSNLNNGIYFLTAKNAKGEVVSNRFLKQ